MSTQTISIWLYSGGIEICLTSHPVPDSAKFKPNQNSPDCVSKNKANFSRLFTILLMLVKAQALGLFPKGLNVGMDQNRRRPP